MSCFVPALTNYQNINLLHTQILVKNIYKSQILQTKDENTQNAFSGNTRRIYFRSNHNTITCVSANANKLSS